MRALGGPVEPLLRRIGTGDREVVTMPSPILWSVTVRRAKDVARFAEGLAAIDPDLASRTTVSARRRWWSRA